MWNEFKKFAIKGNLLDLAVGVVIGNAFTKIINSLVNDIIMPILGIPLGKVDLTNLFIQIGGNVTYPSIEDAKSAGVATINYGLFINNIINFLIIAFSMFLVVRYLIRFKKRNEQTDSPSKTKSCKYCYTTIHLEATRCPNCTSELKKV